jgi:acetylornithine deacetylase
VTPSEILRSLVAIPSVSRLSNRPLIEWVQHRLTGVGWHHRVVSYRDSGGIDKLNLIASPHPLPQGTIHAHLALVCHTDTVPFDPSWPEATTLLERNGMLHGCGACDVKGFLACMIAAAERLDAARPRLPLVFVFTADEEIGCRGARFLLREGVLQARYAIVGEPTSLVPARAGKGYGLAEVHIAGRSAHSAFPEAGRSAILAAMRMIGEIEELRIALQSDRNDAFSPPWTTINIGEIHGGTAKNIVPAACDFLVEWRPIPSQPPESVGTELQRIAAALSRDGIDISVHIARAESGFETPLASPLLAALSAAAPTTLSFGSEAPWLARMGAEAVVFGPGSMLTAHSPAECVPLHELDTCINILLAAIERICSRAE